MTVTIEQGILGLEAYFVWNGSTVLHGQTLPRARVTKIQGLHSLPDADDNRASRTAAIGEVAYPSLARGKTIVYEGVLQAATLSDLRELEASLRSAFADRSNEGSMAHVPYEDYIGEGGDDGYWFYTARVLQLDVPEEQLFDATAVPSPYQRPFTLGLRMSDPRVYWNEEVSEGPDSSDVTVENLGIAPTDPVVEVGITGTGLHDVTISSDAPHQLELVDVDLTGLGAGRIVFDFAARTIEFITTVGAEVTDIAYSLDVATSDWWDAGIPGLSPGQSTVEQSGGDDITVTFRHASW